MKKYTPKKTESISEVSDLLSKSKSVAVVDYKGMDVKTVTEFRKAIKKSGGTYLVTKNTLFKIAANQKDLSLEQTSGFVFSHTDEVTSIKAIADFAKKNSSLPAFKMGLLGDKVLSKEEIIRLSQIPDKNTLISKLLGSLNSPLFGLAYSLNWNLSKLVRTLDAVRAKKA